mmetsp:Transcript_109253/g.273655  ORF Transcript_109253/g.273655 Transcript_109253/m.273655 type:complete len:222 (-) Transcript_109253:568-1233(-)
MPAGVAVQAPEELADRRDARRVVSHEGAHLQIGLALSVVDGLVAKDARHHVQDREQGERDEGDEHEDEVGSDRLQRLHRLRPAYPSCDALVQGEHGLGHVRPMHLKRLCVDLSACPRCRVGEIFRHGLHDVDRVNVNDQQEEHDGPAEMREGRQNGSDQEAERHDEAEQPVDPHHPSDSGDAHDAEGWRVREFIDQAAAFAARPLSHDNRKGGHVEEGDQD